MVINILSNWRFDIWFLLFSLFWSENKDERPMLSRFGQHRIWLQCFAEQSLWDLFCDHESWMFFSSVKQLFFCQTTCFFFSSYIFSFFLFLFIFSFYFSRVLFFFSGRLFFLWFRRKEESILSLSSITVSFFPPFFNDAIFKCRNQEPPQKEWKKKRGKKKDKELQKKSKKGAKKRDRNRDCNSSFGWTFFFMLCYGLC